MSFLLTRLRLLVRMHLLYLDDAGSVGNVHEQHPVLAPPVDGNVTGAHAAAVQAPGGGVSAFETQSHRITQDPAKLAQSIAPGPRRRVLTPRRPPPSTGKTWKSPNQAER